MLICNIKFDGIVFVIFHCINEVKFILWEEFYLQLHNSKNLTNKLINCSRRPHLIINEQGVKIDIQVDLLILFVGKTRRHNIVNASAELIVTVS